MHLYFLRHGIAEERQPGHLDSERHLTKEGKEEMCREAEGMKHLHLRLDAVYTSPYPRAAETAEIVCDTLGLETLHTDERLSAGNFRLGNLQLLLKSLSPNARILLVGHEPDLSALIQNLTGAVIDMKKGGLALVETIRPEPGYGVLLWLLTPRHLTAMR